MREPATTTSLLAFLAVAIAGSAMPVLAQKIPATPLRTLSAAERSEAEEARDRADRMRSELEKRLPRAPVPASSGRPDPLEMEELEGATEVIRAYEIVIERYPHTEIAADSAVRLAGFYQRLRRFDAAARILESVAIEYAGSIKAPKANFEVGLLHLQGRHDPREAIQWFAKVPEPANPSDAEALSFYLSAQQQLLKCELVLGRDKQASERLDGLKTALPQYATELEKFYQFELGARESKPAPESDGDTKTPASDRGKGVTSVADDDLDRRALEDFVRRLGRVRAGAETEKAVAELARHRDAAVEEIERQIAEGPTDFGMVHTSVRVLEKVNSKKSRALLKKIALGEIDIENPGLHGWAAQALINCDPNQSRELLSTSDRNVLATAISSLRGKGMNQALFDALKPHIDSDDPWMRQLTGSFMASDAPRGEVADQALKCIVAILVAVENIPDRDQFDPSSVPSGGYQTTIAEARYHECAGMLYHVKVDNAALHETAKQLQGRARDAVVLALAYRHDKSVYDEIIKLTQDEDAGMFRAWAAATLCEIGTADDIPLLQRLSKTDPLKRSGGGLGAHSNFPVRESAENSIRTFELRAKQK